MTALQLSDFNDWAGWQGLPDIDKVNGILTREDTAVLRSIGSLLVRANQTSRFAVTLLHSHFELRAGELLQDSYECNGTLLTQAMPIADCNSRLSPRSWRFSEAGAIKPVTWILTDQLPQQPVGEADLPLLSEVSRHLKLTGTLNRFGMALPGRLPSPGMIWTEGAETEGRRLIQEEMPLATVKARNPIMTMYLFDDVGDYIISLGCCEQGPSNRGHLKRRHPWGIKY